MRQSGQQSARRGVTETVTRTATQHSGGVHVTLDVVDDAGRYVNEATGKTTVIRPDLSKEDIELKQTAPGRYEADIPLGGQGGYQLQSTLHTNESAMPSASRGVMVGYPDEWQLRPTNAALLKQLADTTGGLYDPTPEELLDINPDKIVHRAVPLWPYLLTAAAMIFVLDVLLRRLEIV